MVKINNFYTDNNINLEKQSFVDEKLPQKINFSVGIYSNL